MNLIEKRDDLEKELESARKDMDRSLDQVLKAMATLESAQMRAECASYYYHVIFGKLTAVNEIMEDMK